MHDTCHARDLGGSLPASLPGAHWQHCMSVRFTGRDHAHLGGLSKSLLLCSCSPLNGLSLCWTEDRQSTMRPAAFLGLDASACSRFIPSERAFASCAGPTVTLEYVPKICILDEDLKEVRWPCQPCNPVVTLSGRRRTDMLRPAICLIESGKILKLLLEHHFTMLCASLLAISAGAL